MSKSPQFFQVFNAITDNLDELSGNEAKFLFGLLNQWAKMGLLEWFSVESKGFFGMDKKTFYKARNLLIESFYFEISETGGSGQTLYRFRGKNSPTNGINSGGEIPSQRSIVGEKIPIKIKTAGGKIPPQTATSRGKNSPTSLYTYTKEENNKYVETPKKPTAKKKSKSHSSKKVFSEGAVLFSEWFRTTLPETQVLSKNWKDAWSKTFDDMVRIDNRNPDLINQVARWARRNEFWAKNFQSPVKLRKRNGDGVQYFDVFRAAMGNHVVSISKTAPSEPKGWKAHLQEMIDDPICNTDEEFTKALNSDWESLSYKIQNICIQDLAMETAI